MFRSAHHRRTYAPRMLGTLALSVLLVLLVFRLWPERVLPEARFAEASAPETVALEEIQPTRQERAATPPPPPPALLPPVEGPDERLPEEDLRLDEPLAGFDLGPPALPEAPAAPGPPSAPAAPAFVETAAESPRVIRAIVPEYPPQAARQGIRARVVVRVLVDAQGRVQQAEVVERILVDRRDREERVAALGHGVEEAALAAAREFRFRPGRHEGRSVSTFTTVTLRVGV